ncbi:MAG TPA: NACHT domain-containing protein [Solirubrobacteraceae bacterium]|jgi:hypothetical protein
MKRLTADRWLALGTALTGIGGTLTAGYWIYVLQASPAGGFWQLPGYLGIAVLTVGFVALLAGFFAPSAGGNLRNGHPQRQRLRRKQRFAKDVRRKLQFLEGNEWSDERFTELEAQVIIERTARSRFALLNLRRPGRSLRYQRSLTKALRSSNEELILLQGDPGCGKSVALRHVALAMAERAASSQDMKSVIPLYVNLKGLRREGEIDASLIQDYVNATLREDINADIERFLDEEFERGLTDGTWFFLFDSFDEMPDILGSSRLDDTVRDYSQAIATFLSGMRPCRGVVASREFHSPKGLPWPKWQIKPLTGKRQRTLIHRYLLDGDKEGALLAGLETADSGIAQDASNPLFLSLLAEYVRQNDSFPLSSHDVYEAYVAQRLITDAERVHERFGVHSDEVRRTAEQIAFCMSDEEGLGLEPSRGELLEILYTRGFAQPDVAMTCMDVLEYLKLVQGQADGSDQRARVFTFAHRRFQEYFTTAAVLRGVGDVSVDALLLDPRWRETAVTLCQLQRDSAAPLVLRAGEILREGATAAVLKIPTEAELTTGRPAPPSEQLDDPWPDFTLEVLGILQAGFSSEPERVPVDVRESAGQLLAHVFLRGLTYDRATAVSVARVAPQPIFDAIIRGAFNSGSQVLADDAYRQVARLRSVPPDLAAEIRRTLLRMTADDTLRREALTVRAQLKRFDAAKSLLRAQRLALVVPRVDIAALLAFVALATAWNNFHLGIPLSIFVGLVAAASHSTLYALSANLGGSSAVTGLRTRGLATISIMLRAYLLTFILIASGGVSSFHDWAILIPSFVALGWAPAALVAVQRGTFTHPAAYPLVFLAPIVAAGHALRQTGWRDLALLSSIVIAVFALFGAIGFILSLLASNLRNLIIGGVGGLLAAVSLANAWRAVRQSVRDAIWYRRWDAQPATRLSLAELMDVLTQVQTLRTATRVLADMRIRELLTSEPETYRFLGDLAHAVQMVPLEDMASLEWRTPCLGVWLEKAPFLLSGSSDTGQRGFEDEIARLVLALRERPERALAAH